MDPETEPEAQLYKATKEATDLLDELRWMFEEVGKNPAVEYWNQEDGSTSTWGQSWESEARDMVERAIDKIQAARAAVKFGEEAYEDVSIHVAVGRVIKRLREGAELKQESLARDMRKAGFKGWKRMTVTEVEAGRRRLTLEELIGLAGLFSVVVPDVLFAGVEPTEVVMLNEKVRIPAQTRAALTSDEGNYMAALARRGPVSRSYLDTHGQEAAGVNSLDEDWRPAVRLRERRLRQIREAAHDPVKVAAMTDAITQSQPVTLTWEEQLRGQ